MCLLESAHGDRIWDALNIGALAEFVPDENGNLAPLLSMQAERVRHWFGMSPLSVASDACFWGTVSDKEIAALDDATTTDIMTAVCGKIDEPMASCLEVAHRRGHDLQYLSAPNVWTQRLLIELKGLLRAIFGYSTVFIYENRI